MEPWRASTALEPLARHRLLLDPRSALVVPCASRGSDEQRVNKRTHHRERSIEGVRGGKQRTFRLGGVARLPQRTIRNVERLWQRNGAPLRLRRERLDLFLWVDGRSLDYRNKIYQVTKPSGWSLRRAVALNGGDDLVSHVIDQRKGAVAML